MKDVSALPADTLTGIDRPGKWSILQVIEHIVRSEFSVLQNLPDPTHLIDRKPGIRSHLGYLSVVIILFFDIPVPVPGSEMVPMNRVSSLVELENEWDKNLSWLTTYFNRITEKTIRRAVFSHPVTGPLTPARAIRIAQLHLDTHRRHITRIKRRLARSKRWV
jgi:hypothetical protein